VLDLRSLTHAELEDFVQTTLGASRFRADQLFRWIHARGARSFEDMTDVPRPLREELARTARLESIDVDAMQVSEDGTRKLRLRAADGSLFESVLIPDGDKLTQCISSQVGCAIDCDFCATAKMGLVRNLTSGEIVDQVYRARELLAEHGGRRITNLVYMGMGEPLHNYKEVVRSLRILIDELGANFSHRRITISTAGLVPAIEKLGREDVHCNLAISLNATTDEIRTRIMPLNKKWNLEKLLAAVRAYPLERRRRVTFEYVLLAGVNDSVEDAARLARLLKGMPCKVNVIPWNPHPLSDYRRPSPEAIGRFQNEVKRLGLPAYLRTPRGVDIDAACGQLANRDAAELVTIKARPEPSPA
jgi:23S rRNA (adenine2503-C2)-methyltransferase